MAVVGALIEFLAAGLTDPDTGTVYSGALVGYYIPGTATGKAVWTNRAKTTPVGGETTSTLDSNGQYVAFGDGLYDIKIFDPEDTGMTTARMTFSSVNITDPATGSSLTDPDFLDGSDSTKIASMDMASITTATTRTYTWPDATTTLVGHDATQTLTNKTLTAPVLNGALSGTSFLDDDTLATATATTAASSESIKAYIDSAQQVSVITGAVATGTTVIPGDDTIPTYADGDEYMTLAITPTSATNKLVIEVIINLANSSASNTGPIAALYQDGAGVSPAIAVGFSGKAAAIDTPSQISIAYVMVAGTTAATTFNVRAGGALVGTTTFNGVNGGRFFGGVMASSIFITEVRV